MKTDKRTGLMGYDDFICQARRALVVGSGQFYAVAIDISNFRYINNIYGLLEGDRFLSGFARECCFGEHIVCATRTHSDHFLLLLEDSHDVNEVVNQIASRHQTFIQRFKQHFSLVTLHMNVGLYALAHGDKDIVLALDKAQSARKQNKGNFNCPILVYTESLNQKYCEESKILPIFEKALENKDILVYMQPKIDVSSGKLVGMEALARLRDTDGTIIPPSILNEVGLGIVCEGVETREEEKMLKEYGCSIIQGFLYDGPLPISDFEKKYMHLQAVGA